MKPYNLLLDIHKSIPSVLSLHFERKPSILRAFVFPVRKKLQLKTSQLNAPIPLYMMSINENGFTITSGKALRIMNLLIQRMTGNYALGHRLLMW